MNYKTFTSAAIFASTVATGLSAERLWENLQLSVGGYNIGASLSRNGGCYDIQVTGDVSGIANNCGSSQNGLWTTNACSQRVDVRGNRDDAIRQIVRSCSQQQGSITLPVGTMMCNDRAYVADVAQSRSAVGIAYSFLSLGSDGTCAILTRTVRLNVVRSYDNVAAPYWELTDGNGSLYAFKETNF